MEFSHVFRCTSSGACSAKCRFSSYASYSLYFSREAFLLSMNHCFLVHCSSSENLFNLFQGCMLLHRMIRRVSMPDTIISPIGKTSVPTQAATILYGSTPIQSRKNHIYPPSVMRAGSGPGEFGGRHFSDK